MVTIGSHASGETGLNTWINGLSAALIIGERPHRMPIGTATRVARTKPVNTVTRLVMIWSTYVGLPVYLRILTLAPGSSANCSALRFSCRSKNASAFAFSARWSA